MPVITVQVAYDPEEQLVLVIDRRHEWAVHKALGEAMQPTPAPVVALRPGAPSSGESVGVNVQDNGVWTEDMVRRLAAEVWRPEVRQALVRMAEAEGRPVSFPELVEATGVDKHTLRAGLASLSKITAHLFGRRTLPMLARQGLAGGTETAYRMPRTIGEWWLGATSTAEGTRSEPSQGS
jgi:hypothetical protein